MATNKNARLAKEADYIKNNADVKSICCGVFYNRSKKAYEPCKNCTKCFKFKEYNTLADKEKETRHEVKFHYIDTFRKCEFYKVRPIDENYILTSITYNMLYINDMACNYVKDLDKGIRDSGDKELQKKYGAAMKRVRRYFGMINEIIGNNMDFFAEYNGGMDDLVDDSADKMQDAIEDIFINLGVENHRLLSRIEMARTMVGFSVLALNRMVSEGHKITKKATTLYAYRLTELQSIMEDLTNWSFRHIDKSFNMNEDKKLHDAYSTLSGKLINYDNVCSSLLKAEELYGQK